MRQGFVSDVGPTLKQHWQSVYFYWVSMRHRDVTSFEPDTVFLCGNTCEVTIADIISTVSDVGAMCCICEGSYHLLDAS